MLLMNSYTTLFTKCLMLPLDPDTDSDLELLDKTVTIGHKFRFFLKDSLELDETHNVLALLKNTIQKFVDKKKAEKQQDDLKRQQKQQQHFQPQKEQTNGGSNRSNSYSPVNNAAATGGTNTCDGKSTSAPTPPSKLFPGPSEIAQSPVDHTNLTLPPFMPAFNNLQPSAQGLSPGSQSLPPLNPETKPEEKDTSFQDFMIENLLFLEDPCVFDSLYQISTSWDGGQHTDPWAQLRAESATAGAKSSAKEDEQPQEVEKEWWRTQASQEQEQSPRHDNSESSKQQSQQENNDNNNKSNDKDSKFDPKKSGQKMPPGFDFNSKNFKVFEIRIMPQHIIAGIVISTLLFSLLSGDSSSGRTNEISWQEFKKDYLDRGLVQKLTVVNRSTVYITSTGFPSSSMYFTIGSVDLFEKRMEEAQKSIPANERVPVAYVERGSILGSIVSFLPTVLLLGALYWMTRRAGGGSGGGIGGGMFGMGQSRAKLYNKATDVNVKFADVAGMDEAKEEIMEFVKFLKEPAKYEELGAKIPRGAILSGPPGTGKTLLAKATAGEANVPFFSVSGSEFIEMFAGVGASRVRDLFKAARAKAPSIIFVDEIDAIGKARNKGFVSGGHDEREATLNQLLVEMDGFESSDHVVVLAGTNRADVLDQALLRPGRFDRHINIDRPDIEGRISIYNVHLKKIKYNKAIPELSGKLAAMTPGFSGADIANVCNEAALIAARQEAEIVELKHFEQAIERVIAGLEKKTRVLVPEKRKVVAYHEAGHAVCGWFLKYADPLVKVSIIPRGSAALGYAQYLPPDQYLVSEDQFKDKMAMALGGRVSEEINFDSVTLGGSDDFQKVTRMAKSMVTQLGMSPKVGHLFYEQSNESPQNPFSERTGEIIDTEIRRIVREAHDRCKTLLTEKKHEVELVAEELLRKEVIGREDMIRLLGPRPFPERNDAFDKYLSKTPEAKQSEDNNSSAQA